MNRKKSLVFYCKTYLKEIERFEIMLQTFNKFNKDKLTMFVSVPEKEILKYIKYVSKTIKIVTDEAYAKKYFTQEKYWGLSEGYINQEICKLSFWEYGVCENYLCIDSDLYFIKNFRARDFMYSAKVPYSVLYMDKDLQTEHFYGDFGKWRFSMIKKIFKKVGYTDLRYRTCHGMQVMNCKVLKNFKINYIKKNDLTYKKLIKIAPYEFTWYNAWLQKAKIIPIIAVDPFFKTFHSRIEYIFSRMRLITENNIADQYFGIVMNSNWKRKAEVQYRNPSFFEAIIYKLINRFI